MSTFVFLKRILFNRHIYVFYWCVLFTSSWMWPSNNGQFMLACFLHDRTIYRGVVWWWHPRHQAASVAVHHCDHLWPVNTAIFGLLTKLQQHFLFLNSLLFHEMFLLSLVHFLKSFLFRFHSMVLFCSSIQMEAVPVLTSWRRTDGQSDLFQVALFTSFLSTCILIYFFIWTSEPQCDTWSIQAEVLIFHLNLLRVQPRLSAFETFMWKNAVSRLQRLRLVVFTSHAHTLAHRCAHTYSLGDSSFSSTS